MESCWLINFEDGSRMIISEKLHKEEVERNWAGRARRSEEHWFDLRTCLKRNRGVPVFGFSSLYKGAPEID